MCEKITGNGIPKPTEENVCDAEADDRCQHGCQPPFDAQQQKARERCAENEHTNDAVREPRFHDASVGTQHEYAVRA